MSTLYDLDEFTDKVIGTFLKFKRQYPGDELRTFQSWIAVFVAWTGYEDVGPTSSIPECTATLTPIPNGWNDDWVQPQTGVKSSSDEPTIGISKNDHHWDEVPLDWQTSSAPWNDDSWINPGWK